MSGKDQAATDEAAGAKRKPKGQGIRESAENQ
jgi:hypothetical protein